MRSAVAVATVIALSLVATASPVGAANRPRQLAHWDPRLLKYVEFVEKTRGLPFEHPVRAHFLPDKKFERRLRGDEKPTKADKTFEKQQAGEYHALGLVGNVDYGSAGNDIGVEGTVGFYDYADTKDLFVRGTSLKSIDAQVTVVHELTHALQDQHFDLIRMQRHATDGSQQLALDFLIEGDAVFVEDSYIQTLSKKERRRYFGDVQDFIEGEDVPETAPYVIDLYFSAPYTLGEGYVAALDPSGGTSGRNRAFRHPPKTEEVLIDPLALQQHEPAKKVPRPKLHQGQKKVYGPEQFGVLTLYLILATRLDPRTALRAVTGWGGDSYVGFEEHGDACVRINVTGDRSSDTNELEDALRQWQAAMPDGAVQVERARSLITVTACEAAGVEAPTRATFDSVFYGVLGQRVFSVLSLVRNGLSTRDARCVTDRATTDPVALAALDRAIEENRSPTKEEFAIADRAFVDAYRPCGVEPPS